MAAPSERGGVPPPVAGAVTAATIDSTSTPRMTVTTTMTDTTPDRIHLASCNSQHYDAVLWPAMMRRGAKVLVWAGDVVYGDDFEYIPYEERRGWKEHMLPRRKKDATPQRMEQLFSELLQHPGYQQYLHPPPHPMNGQNEDDKEGRLNAGRNDDGSGKGISPPVVVLGTVDDHDYGTNNGDQTFRYQRDNTIAYVDFLQRSNAESYPNAFSVMMERAKAGKGVYGVKVMDFRRPPGKQLLSDEEASLDPDVVPTNNSTTTLSDRSVAIFVLDCRSHKTPWPSLSDQIYHGVPDDTEGDFLGEEQWIWLVETLRRSTAAVNIVVNGLQVHADHFIVGEAVEEWSRFPRAQHRLYQALLQPNVRSPLLISGDVHMGQILRRDCFRPETPAEQKQQETIVSPIRTLYEVTTSGMTHSWGTHICARPKELFICRSTFFNRIVGVAMHAAHHLGVWTDLVSTDQSWEGSQRGLQYTIRRNFAELEMDWDNRTILTRVWGEDAHKPPIMSHRWDMDVLSGRRSVSDQGLVTPADVTSAFNQLHSHQIAQHGDWICVNYRGPASYEGKKYGFFVPLGIIVALSTFPVWGLLVAGYCILAHKRRVKVKMA